MRISWSWLSELVDLSGVQGPHALADLLTFRGLEVEEVIDQSAGFDKVVTAQILEKNPHPQADRLSLCQVTTGSGTPMEIVCGAQNMKAGDKVALAQIGAHLPNGLVIKESKIRGVTSKGMLCSEEELKLKDSSEGILILPPDTKLGQPLAQVLGRNDAVLVFKLTANRGDCLSHFGMAREIAAALGRKVKRPDAAKIEFGSSPISIHLEAGEKAPQFWGCYIEGVKIGPSPDWVVKRLEALGSRSINNVVDATNLLVLELGQPVHAYDADLIEGKKLSARMAKSGESLKLLDGSEVRLDGTELVIADGARAVGLAGVMGGGNSEVSDQTTRVFLECAEFDPSTIRRAASKHQKKTEASHRFERGVDPAGVGYALARLAHLVFELAGGKIQGATFATLPSRDPKKAKLERPIELQPDFISKFLGMEIDALTIRKVLDGLDCQVTEEKNQWTVHAPSYRRDLAIREDLAEEVARSVGYDRIPSKVPVLTSEPTPLSTTARDLELISRAKRSLVNAGMLETINFAFTSKTWLQTFGMDSQSKLLNPISEEQEYLVPSLLPGLIGNALNNWRHHFGSEAVAIRLFEIRPTFHPTAPTGELLARAGDSFETGMTESWKLALALSGPRFAQGLRQDLGEIDFYDLKGILETLFAELGTRGVRMMRLSESRNAPEEIRANFHPGQSVQIWVGKDVAGYAGLLHPGRAKKLKARAPLWMAELDWGILAGLSRPMSQPRAFQSWPEFPPMERDFALLVKQETPADKITQVAIKAGKPIAKVAKIFDIYRGSQVAEGMTSVAVRVIFFGEGRSLQEAETEEASTRILQAWKKELGAELR